MSEPESRKEKIKEMITLFLIEKGLESFFNNFPIDSIDKAIEFINSSFSFFN